MRGGAGFSRGVALPTVLVTLAIVSTLAVSVLSSGSGARRTITSAEERARERWLLDAALARGVSALIVPGDEAVERLRSGEALVWEHAGARMLIGVEAESEKVDLNRSDPDLVRSALTAALGSTRAEQAYETATTARRNGNEFAAPEQVLPLADRFGEDATRLRRVLTVYGGRSAPAWPAVPLFPSALPEAQSVVRRGLPGTPPRESTAAGSGNLERPVYTVSAQLESGCGHTCRRREVTILVDLSHEGRFMLAGRYEGPAADAPP